MVAAPEPGLSVCPVLYQQHLLAVQPKLNPAHPEQDSMRPGEAWQAVALPEGLPGSMGVLICLDFLDRGNVIYQQLVAEPLRACRFLAVPSLTPHYTLIPDFAGKVWDEARRYHRPVLYADIASGGGASIYVDEGAPTDLRRFPQYAGYLEPGDEGVIVADVDLGYEHTGRSRTYDDQPAVYLCGRGVAGVWPPFGGGGLRRLAQRAIATGGQERYGEPESRHCRDQRSA